MRRRDFVTLLGGAAAVWPLPARSQQSSGKMPVVGVLWHAGSAEEEDVYLSVLVKAFNDLGYVEGKNIRLEHRFPAENPDRYRTLGQELIDAKPDAIVAVTLAGAVALKKLTGTIPIVFVLVPDPIACTAWPGVGGRLACRLHSELSVPSQWYAMGFKNSQRTRKKEAPPSRRG